MLSVFNKYIFPIVLQTFKKCPLGNLRIPATLIATKNQTVNFPQIFTRIYPSGCFCGDYNHAAIGCTAPGDIIFSVAINELRVGSWHAGGKKYPQRMNTMWMPDKIHFLL